MIGRWFDHIRHSLVWRTVVFANIASITIVIAVLGLALRLADHRFEGMHDLTLWDQIDTLQRSLRADGDVVTVDLPPDLRSEYARADGAMRFAVVTAKGEFRAGSIGLDRALASPSLTQTAPYFSYEDPITRQVGRGAQVALAGSPSLMLQVGQGPQHRDVLADSVMEEFVEHFAFALIIGLIVQIIVTTLTIRSTLKPLVQIANATTPSPDPVARRLPARDAPIELRPVVTTINALIGDLERNLERQRRFTADAAHQLRTPLARLEARISAVATPDIAGKLRDPLDQIGALVSGLLVVARAEAVDRSPDTRVDLVDIARRIGADLAPGAIAAGVELALGTTVPTIVRGDALWIGEALTNVIANAIRYSPPGAIVDIDVPGDGSIVVRDHGPGIPEADRPHVFERFWRGRNEAPPGAGLGLSITAAVMLTHGGTVEADDAPGGGARFRLIFPKS